VVAAALLAGTGVSVWQAVEATNARKLADKRLKDAEAEHARATQEAEKRIAGEAAVAKAMNDFLQNDILQRTNQDPAMRDALLRAADKVGERFKDQPLVEAAMRTIIGHGLLGLSEVGAAEPHLVRAVAIRRQLLGDTDQATLESMQTLATVWGWVDRLPEAIQLHEHIVRTSAERFGDDHPDTLSRKMSLAIDGWKAGHWLAALSLNERVLESQIRVCGLDDDRTVGTMHNLAIRYTQLGRLPEARALYDMILPYCRVKLKAGDQGACWPLLTYGQYCIQAGEPAAAEQVLREALEWTNLRTDLNVDQSFANISGFLAISLAMQGDFDAAEPLAETAIKLHEDFRTAKNIPHFARRYYWISTLGAIYTGQQRFAEAELLLLSGYEGMKENHKLAGEQFRIIDGCKRIIHYYETVGQPEEVAAWSKVLEAEYAVVAGFMENGRDLKVR
jgi:tetratricopeptide (TPR) repeat protein